MAQTRTQANRVDVCRDQVANVAMEGLVTHDARAVVEICQGIRTRRAKFRLDEPRNGAHV